MSAAILASICAAFPCVVDGVTIQRAVPVGCQRIEVGKAFNNADGEAIGESVLSRDHALRAMAAAAKAAGIDTVQLTRFYRAGWMKVATGKGYRCKGRTQ